MSDLDHYDYPLPRELIAQQPLANRADARLLIVDRASQTLDHRHVRDLPEILRRGDCLVTNDTRVVPARLVGRREQTGGHWEGLFLESDAAGSWRLLCKARGKLNAGENILLVDRHGNDAATLRLIAKEDDGVWIARPQPLGEPLKKGDWLGADTGNVDKTLGRDVPVPFFQPDAREFTWQLLDRVGRVPLPHYIRKGEMVEADLQRYQTVFARRPGAVAAPTAGLHFTRDLLSSLALAGIENCQVTLHVGIDTFRPITAENLAEHAMHSERGQIEPAAVEKLLRCRQQRGRIVAVGTTSVRVLETAAAAGGLQPWSGQTNLFIRPPYTFRAVDGLLTNFHLPRTTLLVLVRTFGGDELMRRAYEEAVREQYRFYSYGDAMLIL